MKTSKLLTVLSAALLFAACQKMPVIDKEYNPVKIDKEASSLTGTFRQGDELSGAKIVLSYENGLGRQAEVLVPEVNGVSGEPFRVTLASGATGNGSGTLEIPLKGTPKTRDRTTLRPTIKLGTHEVFLTFDVTPVADIVLDAGASTVGGTFKIFRPVQDGKISVRYTSTKAHSVEIGVADVVGVSAAEFEANLPAAPDGGFIDIPLKGTPTDQGTQNFVVRMVKDGTEYSVTKTITILGEVTFDVAGSSVSGELVKGEAISGAKITLKYTADRAMDMTVVAAAVDGISAAAFPATLAAGTGTIDIPLTGTPASDGEKTLVVTLEENNIKYTANINVTVVNPEPPKPFEPETITFHGLTYNTVFVDLNDDGFIRAGEVWLDRNMGATSNDPGTYGAAGANPDSFGGFYQWGKPYGETAYDAAYTINYGATMPWNTICPEGYEVPTMAQYVNAVAKLVGGTVSGNNVTGVDGITEKLMASPLGFPMSGWFANNNRDHEQNGTMGTYWTVSEGSSTAPWRFQLNNNTATATGGGWADKVWQVPVRCIKALK